jgi:hypothetical protein
MGAGAAAQPAQNTRHRRCSILFQATRRSGQLPMHPDRLAENGQFWHKKPPAIACAHRRRFAQTVELIQLF